MHILLILILVLGMVSCFLYTPWTFRFRGCFSLYSSFQDQLSFFIITLMVYFHQGGVLLGSRGCLLLFALLFYISNIPPDPFGPNTDFSAPRLTGRVLDVSWPPTGRPMRLAPFLLGASTLIAWRGRPREQRPSLLDTSSLFFHSWRKEVWSL